MKRGVTSIAILVLVAACGSGSDPSTTQPSAPTTTTPVTSPTTGGGDPGGAAVATAETSLGTILVDPEGLTMYVFTMDTDGESTCYSSCESLWPSVPGDVPIGPGLNSSMFGTTNRTDGTTQLTVNGQPLYIYAGDTGPGDTDGQGVSGVWFVVGADGELIEGPSGEGYGDGY